MVKLSKFENITLIFALSSLVLLLIARVKVIFLYNFDTGGLEYELIYEIQRILSGKSIYPDPLTLPFHITQKTPLYHFLVVSIAHVIGLRADDVYELFVLSRGVTFFIVVMIGFTTYFIAKHNFSLKSIPSVIFSIFSMLILSHSHHYHSRMDALYSLIFFILFYLLNKYQFEINIKKGFIYILLSVAIFYAKQNGLAIIGFVCGALLLNNQPKKNILGYIFGSMVFILAIPFFLNQDFRLLYQNIVVGVDNGISFHFLKKFFSSEYQILFLLFTLLSILSVSLKTKKSIKKNVLLIFVLCSFLLGVTMSFKYGAGHNYFNEFKILSFLCASVFVFDDRNTFLKLEEYKKVIFFAFCLLVSHMGLKQYYNSILQFRYDNDKYIYEGALVVKDFMLNDLGLKKEEFIYIQEPGFLINILHENVILPTKSVFDASFYKEDKKDKLKNIYTEFDDGRVKYLILSHRTFEKPINILGYEIDSKVFIKRLNKNEIYRINN